MLQAATHIVAVVAVDVKDVWNVAWSGSKLLYIDYAHHEQRQPAMLHESCILSHPYTMKMV